MESVKQLAKRIVEKLPDDATWELVLYRVYLNSKVLKGLQEIDEGKGIPNEQVFREMEEWLTSSGRQQPVATSVRS